MKNKSCCFCCWHYSPTQQKCIYWGADGLYVNPDDSCHYSDKGAFDSVCEFEEDTV